MYDTINQLLSKLFKVCEAASCPFPDGLVESDVMGREIWGLCLSAKKLYLNSSEKEETVYKLVQELKRLDPPLDTFIPIGINSEGTLRMAIKVKGEMGGYYEDPTYAFKVERLNNYEKLIRLGENFE